MAAHSTRTRDYFLHSLHIFGFISLPNFFQNSWTNKLHKLIVRQILFKISLLVMSLQVACTFIYAIHDIAEFLQRLLESAAIITYVTEAIHASFRLKELTDLFALQNRLFTVSDRKIYGEYLRKENLEVNILIVFIILTNLGLVLETMMPMSERTLYLMTTIYHKKHPARILPLHLWTPSFFDISEKVPFIIVYLLEVYAFAVGMVAIFNVTVLQIFVPTSLVAQYKMFAKFVQKIGMEHRDRLGENIFYTNVSTGEYMTETKLLHDWTKNITMGITGPNISGERVRRFLEFRAWKKKKYQICYVKQIILRHQELNYVMSKYHQVMHKLSLPSAFPFFTTLILSFYQLAYLKHLPWFYCTKVLIEFLFLVGGMFHFTTQSEMLNYCNEIVNRSVYNSQWYNAGPEVKKNVRLMLQNAQKPKHFRIVDGMITINYKFMIKLWKAAFSFLNFMKMNGQL
ncbi:hypothetical protein WDU94_002833 [Cyamophila willieti]